MEVIDRRLLLTGNSGGQQDIHLRQSLSHHHRPEVGLREGSTAYCLR